MTHEERDERTPELQLMTVREAETFSPKVQPTGAFSPSRQRFLMGIINKHTRLLPSRPALFPGMGDGMAWRSATSFDDIDLSGRPDMPNRIDA